MIPWNEPITVAGAVKGMLAIVAATVGYLGYQRKSGISLRGLWTTGWSAECSDIYVTSVLIENLKDRAVTIFGIYLRMAHNCYLTLETFEKKTPLILKPYETHHRTFPVLDCYYSNFARVQLDDLLHGDGIKRRLVLSTSHGKYVVPSCVRIWSPTVDAFTNRETVVVNPARLALDGQFFGDHVRYALRLAKGGVNQTVGLQKGYQRLPVQIPASAFDNFDAVEQILEGQKAANILNCDSFELVDLEDLRDQRRLLTARRYFVQPAGWVRYAVGGRYSAAWRRINKTLLAGGNTVRAPNFIWR